MVLHELIYCAQIAYDHATLGTRFQNHHPNMMGPKGEIIVRRSRTVKTHVSTSFLDPGALIDQYATTTPPRSNRRPRPAASARS